MPWAGDFSGRPPGAAALIASGMRVVIRYIGLGSEGKQISKAEWQDYINNGVIVLLVAELGINDAWEGLDDYALGVARAKLVLADIANTAPASVDQSTVCVACAADAHASGSQIADAVKYAQGFASVIGSARAGFYGFSETVTAVRNAGAVGWLWLAGSEPSEAAQTWVSFWQRNRSDPGSPARITINGTDVDVNEIYHLPTVATGGFLMALTDQQQNDMAYQVKQLWDAFGQPYANNKGQWIGWIATLLGRWMPAATNTDPKDAITQAGGLPQMLLGMATALTQLTAKVDALAARPASVPDIDEDAFAQALLAHGFQGGASVEEVKQVVRSAFAAAGNA